MTQSLVTLDDSQAKAVMPLVSGASSILAVIERAAMNPAADIDKMERLFQMHQRMVDREAEQAFNEALCRAQANMKAVAADARNTQTSSNYAPCNAIDKVVRPIYSAEGFSLSFDTEPLNAESILILCHLSHKGGHTRTYKAPMPADGKGAKGGDVMTKTHATGAAITYGMRYLVKMIFNVAVGEDDNDGNGSKGGNSVPEADFQKHRKLILEAPDTGTLNRVFSAAFNSCGQDRDTRQAYTALKDQRLKELQKGGPK